MTLTIDF